MVKLTQTRLYVCLRIVGHFTFASTTAMCTHVHPIVMLKSFSEPGDAAQKSLLAVSALLEALLALGC